MSAGLKYRYVTDESRSIIAKMYQEGCRVPEIAEAVGLHEASVYRELNRGLTEELDEHGNFVYDPKKARLDAALARKNKGRKKAIGDGRSKRNGQVTGC